ncbi:NifB/NifX family molybdenum-iron cluster-binding protein [Desulforhopalus singaporensis]|uniref:Predicted Fe-Mo cluster-binding protein, NifX family n=1 Tax=Desulforhopalus singaporensis TaxID=91360 RepID=A0A1H0MGV4_9BACT|nr:NifB/NifX family molybdenum-iron cluster-binding protein [Desulforhopalus singaporensis]SDO79617.1 Predicted Fe-Mo cluster-binding protein, NifX family [Desulforhopalus singaporensis]
MLIAIPSDNPGGMEAQRSDHFGHCDVFTLVELDDSKEVKSVVTLQNGEHQAGGCMVPVALLKNAGVDAIVVGGIGARPMQGFANEGIAVYFADRNSIRTVAQAATSFAAGRLPVMHPEQVCKGSGNCSH